LTKKKLLPHDSATSLETHMCSCHVNTIIKEFAVQTICMNGNFFRHQKTKEYFRRIKTKY